MRIVKTIFLKEGDILARDIISYEGGVLLKSGTRFKEVFKQKLLERDVDEVYIDDEISKGIEPVGLLSPEMHQRLTEDIKREYENLGNNLTINVNSIHHAVDTLIEELSRKDLVWEIQDLKVNDLYTYKHCIGVAILSDIVCRKLNLNRKLTYQIIMGALIHDIGKVILPKDILNKPGALTKEEYELIKTHTEVGYKMVKDNQELSSITKLIVLCHHEREDGSGYPLGKGEDLHIGSKIVAACDLYHALISDRCYRQGLPLNEVVAIASKEKINPAIRNVINQSLAFYPVGSTVKLSNNKLGIVEKNFSKDIKRPLVRTVYNLETKHEERQKINLQEEEEIYIEERIYKLPWE